MLLFQRKDYFKWKLRKDYFKWKLQSELYFKIEMFCTLFGNEFQGVAEYSEAWTFPTRPISNEFMS